CLRGALAPLFYFPPYYQEEENWGQSPRGWEGGKKVDNNLLNYAKILSEGLYQ
ncbi:unnamed protein product, partial [marine sediment metagenome]